MRQLIAKYIGLPIQDIIRKTNIMEKYKELIKSQYWSNDELENYQFTKLKNLLNYSYDNIIYYREKYKSIGLLPNDIKEISDIKYIPIIKKDDLRNENSKFINNNLIKNNIKIIKTGGTTGVPLSIYKDAQTRSITKASYYRWYNWMGINPIELNVTLWGMKTVLRKSYKYIVKDKMIDILQNNITINSFNLNYNEMLLAIKLINKKKPKLIKGYASALLDLAIFIKENNCSIKYIPKSLSTTSEVLSKKHRSIIEEVFKSKVYDQYGSGEIGGIAYECKAHEGLHITMEHAIVESLDNNNDIIYDKPGRFIITDLDNYAMPIIRYEIGDRGIISSEKCRCGIQHKIINKIDGRSIDLIVLSNGNKADAGYYTDILQELKLNITRFINKYQVYQNIPGEIEFRIETNNKERFEDNDEINILYSALIKNHKKVNIKYYKKIPYSPNGKYRNIYSNICSN